MASDALLFESVDGILSRLLDQFAARQTTFCRASYKGPAICSNAGDRRHVRLRETAIFVQFG